MNQVQGRYVCKKCRHVSERCWAEENMYGVLFHDKVFHTCGTKAEFIKLWSPEMDEFQGSPIDHHGFRFTGESGQKFFKKGNFAISDFVQGESEFPASLTCLGSRAD